MLYLALSCLLSHACSLLLTLSFSLSLAHSLLLALIQTREHTVARSISRTHNSNTQRLTVSCARSLSCSLSHTFASLRVRARCLSDTQRHTLDVSILRVCCSACCRACCGVCCSVCCSVCQRKRARCNLHVLQCVLQCVLQRVAEKNSALSCSLSHT